MLFLSVLLELALESEEDSRGFVRVAYLRRRTANPSQHSPILLRCHRRIVRSVRDAGTPCFLQARFSTRPSWPRRRRRRRRVTSVFTRQSVFLFFHDGAVDEDRQGGMGRDEKGQG